MSSKTRDGDDTKQKKRQHLVNAYQDWGSNLDSSRGRGENVLRFDMSPLGRAVQGREPFKILIDFHGRGPTEVELRAKVWLLWVGPEQHRRGECIVAIHIWA